MAASGILLNILAAWIGALLALVTFELLAGNKRRAHGLLDGIFSATEKFGTFSPEDIASANDPTSDLYEFPLQTNDARRPARKNNRTRKAVYPTSGAPSMLPSAPMSSTTEPRGPGAAAYDPHVWADNPGVAAFDGQLLSDLLPNQTAMPVRSLDDVYGAQMRGRASRVPVDS
jgi:hypothetical protein